MSSAEYEDQYDDGEAICPYCQHSFQPESEDYSEDSREIECDACEQKFYLRQSFSVTHITQPDCELNGKQHQYVARDIKGGETHPFCEVCDKCQPLSRSGSQT